MKFVSDLLWHEPPEKQGFGSQTSRGEKGTKVTHQRDKTQVSVLTLD